MMLSIVKRLYESGDLKKLIKAGYVSSTILVHYEIFLEVDKEKKITGKGTTAVVKDTAIKLNISETTIYKSIKAFKQ